MQVRQKAHDMINLLSQLQDPHQTYCILQVCNKCLYQCESQVRQYLAPLFLLFEEIKPGRETCNRFRRNASALLFQLFVSKMESLIAHFEQFDTLFCLSHCCDKREHLSNRKIQTIVLLSNEPCSKIYEARFVWQQNKNYGQRITVLGFAPRGTFPCRADIYQKRIVNQIISILKHLSIDENATCKGSHCLRIHGAAIRLRAEP